MTNDELYARLDKLEQMIVEMHTIIMKFASIADRIPSELPPMPTMPFPFPKR